MSEILTPKQMKSLGLNHAWELLFFPPDSYEDYTSHSESVRGDIECFGRSIELNERANFLLFLISATTAFDKNKPPRITLRFSDINGQQIFGTVFGNIKDWKELPFNRKYFISAKLDTWMERRQLKDLVLVEDRWIGKIKPYYKGVRSVVSGDTLEQAIAAVLQDSESLKLACEELYNVTGQDADGLFKHVGIRDLSKWFSVLHRPSNMTHCEMAKSLLSKLALLELHRKRQALFEEVERVKVEPMGYSLEVLDDLVEKTGYTLSSDQINTIYDILDDLSGITPAYRLINGDVGTGKTISFCIPLLMAYRAGRSVWIMTSNEVLVAQITASLKKLDSKLTVSSVTSSLKPLNNADFLVGTSALIHLSKKTGIKPDVLLIDEQQKFSRDQRFALRRPDTHYFEATATAVPQSLAMLTHPYAKLSLLRRAPVEKIIRSEILTAADKVSLFERIKIASGKGERALVVYPKLNVEDSEGEFKNARRGFTAWNATLPGQVAMLTGDMSSEEKERSVMQVRVGKCTVLVCTSTVEVGLDLPSVSIVVVVSAERYGFSQLHQLRGRLCRNGGEGLFVMYCPDKISEEIASRLQFVCDTNDGFALAEADLQYRGFGDLGEDSDESTGDTRAIFRNVKLSPKDLLELERLEFDLPIQ